MGASYVGLALLLFLSHQAQSAPVAEEGTDLQEQESYPAEGCYYNYEHYEEGDRIVTNEPCLNCTCHNHMLMCYLRVCPFTKAIGQDCTVEKKPDQCCPVITCPEVPVQLLTSSTTRKPTTISTAVGRPDNYGCTLSDNTFYPDGAQVPSDSRKPCELCYCIRNRTACVMQECTLQVEGCQPVYQQGVCCPVRYDCDYDSVTTPGTTVGLVTTPGGPSQCLHDGVVYNDGEMVEFKGKSPCEHCYCMRGDVVCAVQECGTPLQAPDCVPLPPPPGHCCPDTFQCANGTVPLESLLGKPESQEDSHSSEIHSEETEHSNEPVNDNAAEGSESSEEQKKPHGEDSVNGQESQNKFEDSGSEGTHTLEPSAEKSTETPLTGTPSQEVTQDNQVLHDAGEIESHSGDSTSDSTTEQDNQNKPESHPGDSTSDSTTEQDNQNKPELAVNTPEEDQNIIHGENDSKPVGDLNSESLVHEKPEGTETNENPESQTPIEESNDDVTKPEAETISKDEENNEEGNHQSILNETGNDNNDLPNSSDNTHNEEDSSLSHGDESKVPEHNTVVDSQHHGEDQENIHQDIPNETVEDNHLNTSGLPSESSPSDSEETMVTGDDSEGHKQTGSEGEEKDQQEGENKEPSTESPHSYDTAHSTEGSDIHLSTSTDSNSFHETNENVQEIPNFTHESTPESDSEKNRIHGVTPETYTEVSVETVEVHTSTPEINHPQQGPTTQVNHVDDSPVATEGPAVVQNDDQGHIETNEKPDDHEVTTIITNNEPSEHDVTTMLDTGNIPRIPGEGNCIIDGHTYKHNSDVHTSNACQVSCKCLNSIVHCKLVECPPAPTQYANCMPLQEPDSCCPTYTCDDNPSLPLESHSQVSTEYPEGTDKEESSHHAQDGSHSTSDHEVPSHDQAHSSPEGSESPTEEDEKPDIASDVNEETGSVPNNDAVDENGGGTEPKPSEGEHDNLNVDNTITNGPSNAGSEDLEQSQVSGDPAENTVESETPNENKGDTNNQVEGTHTSDSGTHQSQEPNEDAVTSEDSALLDDNPESPPQNGEGGLENQQIFEDGSTSHNDNKPQSVEDGQNIGIVSIEHDDSRPTSLNENGEPDENVSDSVSHSSATTTALYQSDVSDNSKDKLPEHEESVDQQEGTSALANDQTSLPNESENDHFPDQVVSNQISNNEVIHQAHPGSDFPSEHSPESPTNIEDEAVDSESENKPTESNNDAYFTSSITPEGAHDNTDPSEIQESTQPQTSDNEPGQQNESSEKENETSQNENGSESSDDHPQNEKEHNDNESNEINHDVNQDSPVTNHQPEEHLNTGSIDNTVTDAHPAGNQEEPSTLDDANINTADNNDGSPATEDHQAEISDHEVDENSVHNEVGSEVPAQPESNESSNSQTQEHDSSEPSTESGNNETVENDNNDKPNADSETSENETVEPSSQSSHPESSHDAHPDSTPTEHENNVDSLPGDSEQDNSHEAESNAAESTNEMDKPEHDSHLKPQDNIIPIEDGVGGIVQHETPNEIEPIFVGEHSLPGVEHESAEHHQDTEVHHTEPALEETNGDHQDGSSLSEDAPATQNTSEEHQTGSLDSSAEDAHQTLPTEGEDDNNQATSSEVEESHDGSKVTDGTQPQTSPEEGLIHHDENEPNSGDSDKHTVPSSIESEDHHEIESNEIVEGSHDLPVSSEIESGHDTSGDEESNQDTSTFGEGHSTESSEETEKHHQIGQAISEDDLTQGTPAPIHNEGAQHDLSSTEVEDHHEQKPVSIDEEQGIPASNEHSEGHQDVSPSSTQAEGSHESVSSEVHDTSSSSETGEEQDHTSTSTEGESNDIVPSGEGHHDTPASQENSEEHVTAEEEHPDTSTSQETNEQAHHDIPPSQEVNEDDVVHSGEHHETPVSQETSEGEHESSEGEHHEIPVSEEDSEGGTEPSEEEQHSTSASQEVTDDKHAPSGEENHDTPTSQEVSEGEHVPSGEENHDTPTSQEVGEGEHVPSGEENHDSPASQEVSEGDHEPSEEDHNAPASQEVNGGEHEPSEENHNEPASQEVTGDENGPSGEQTNDTPASQEVSEGDHEPSVGEHHDVPASQEVSEGEHIPSEGEHHDTPTSHETSDGHLSSGEEHLDIPASQEVSEGDHEPSEGEHLDISASQEVSEGEHISSEGEPQDISASQEVSEGDHKPSEEEHHDIPSSQEIGEGDHEPSEEEHHDTPTLHDTSDGLLPSEEEHLDIPASQEVSEGDHEPSEGEHHVPSEAEHHDIPASQEISESDHKPSEGEHHDTPTPNETSESYHEPSEGEHLDTPTPHETSDEHHPSGEEHLDIPASQEVSEGDHEPSEGEHHEPSEGEHHDIPSSQEIGEGDHKPSEGEHHDIPSSQEIGEGDHEPSEEEHHNTPTPHETSDEHLPSGEEHPDIPASQEVSEGDHEPSEGEHHEPSEGEYHDNPTSQENSDGGHLPSGEGQYEQIIPSDESGKEPSLAESGFEQVSPESSAEHNAIPTPDEHHDSSAAEPSESPESSEDAGISSDNKHDDPHSPQDPSHHEISKPEHEESVQVNHDASMPTSSDSDLHIPEHGGESGSPVVVENVPIDEISHHEDNVKPDLTIADHHFEENEHSPEQSSSEGTEHQDTPVDNETINPSQDTGEHELESSHSDATSEHQQELEEPGADILPSEQSSSHEVPSSPELVPVFESDILDMTSGSEGNVGSNIQHGNEPQEGANNEESSKPLDDNIAPSNEQSEPLNPVVEPGTEEQTGLDASQSENSSLDQTSTQYPPSHENLPSNQDEGTNQESSSHEPGHDDNSEPSEAAFPAEEHGGPTAGLTDSDAVINAVYDLVHQQEESNDVGDTKKPSLDQDVDIPNSEVTGQEIPSTSQESDVSGGHEKPDLTHDITMEEHKDSYSPQEHQDGDHDESLPQEHKPPIQHLPVGGEHEEEPTSQPGQEFPDQPVGTENEQSIVNEDSPEIPHEHVEHPSPVDTLAVDEHSEGEAEHPPAEEIGTIPVEDHKDSDHSDDIQLHTEEVTVPHEGSSPDNLPETPDHPIHHTPEYISAPGDEEKPSGSSSQAESSTENTFTTAMHEVFGSTNVVTPDQHQVQENEFFQPGGPLFPHWSQKPVEKVTTTKPQTVPQIPEDSQYPIEPEQDYEEEDSNYSPGTCRYGGKVYLSAQQIPRDDPCDFCFCFRSDIICLQQSCPPPIQHCYQENIPGFCCPRYECHVSMATMVNLTTTTTTTTTTLPPHFLAHAYKGHAKKTGCQVKGVAYRVGERIPSTSGPCLECRCGADGQMKCDPTVCNPQETLLRQVMDAAVISRRRRHIMTTPYFTARRLR